MASNTATAGRRATFGMSSPIDAYSSSSKYNGASPMLSDNLSSSSDYRTTRNLLYTSSHVYPPPVTISRQHHDHLGPSSSSLSHHRREVYRHPSRSYGGTSIEPSAYAAKSVNGTTVHSSRPHATGKKASRIPSFGRRNNTHLLSSTEKSKYLIYKKLNEERAKLEYENSLKASATDQVNGSSGNAQLSTLTDNHDPTQEDESENDDEEDEEYSEDDALDSKDECNSERGDTEFAQQFVSTAETTTAVEDDHADDDDEDSDDDDLSPHSLAPGTANNDISDSSDDNSISSSATQPPTCSRPKNTDAHADAGNVEKHHTESLSVSPVNNRTGKYSQQTVSTTTTSVHRNLEVNDSRKRYSAPVQFHDGPLTGASNVPSSLSCADLTESSPSSSPPPATMHIIDPNNNGRVSPRIVRSSIRYQGSSKAPSCSGSGSESCDSLTSPRLLAVDSNSMDSHKAFTRSFDNLCWLSAPSNTEQQARSGRCTSAEPTARKIKIRLKSPIAINRRRLSATVLDSDRESDSDHGQCIPTQVPVISVNDCSPVNTSDPRACSSSEYDSECQSDNEELSSALTIRLASANSNYSETIVNGDNSTRNDSSDDEENEANYDGKDEPASSMNSTTSTSTSEGHQSDQANSTATTTTTSEDESENEINKAISSIQDNAVRLKNNLMPHHPRMSKPANLMPVNSGGPGVPCESLPINHSPTVNGTVDNSSCLPLAIDKFNSSNTRVDNATSNVSHDAKPVRPAGHKSELIEKIQNELSAFISKCRDIDEMIGPTSPISPTYLHVFRRLDSLSEEPEDEESASEASLEPCRVKVHCAQPMRSTVSVALACSLFFMPLIENKSQLIIATAVLN